MSAEEISDEEFRAGGRTGEARNHPLSEAGFMWLCAFNGVPPENAPRTWRFASNAYMRGFIEEAAAKERLAS